MAGPRANRVKGLVSLSRKKGLRYSEIGPVALYI